MRRRARPAARRRPWRPGSAGCWPADKPTLPTTMHVRPAPQRRLVVDPDGGVQRRMVGVLRRRDEVGRRPDRALQLRVGTLHDHRVDARCQPSRRNARAARRRHSACTRSIGLSTPSKATSRAAASSRGMPMLRASRLPVPAGIRPNGMPRAGQPGADHADRAVAAGAEHQVDLFGHRLRGHRAPGIVGSGLQPERLLQPRTSSS